MLTRNIIAPTLYKGINVTVSGINSTRSSNIVVNNSCSCQNEQDQITNLTQNFNEHVFIGKFDAIPDLTAIATDDVKGPIWYNNILYDFNVLGQELPCQPLSFGNRRVGDYYASETGGFDTDVANVQASFNIFRQQVDIPIPKNICCNLTCPVEPNCHPPQETKYYGIFRNVHQCPGDNPKTEVPFMYYKSKQGKLKDGIVEKFIPSYNTQAKLVLVSQYYDSSINLQTSTTGRVVLKNALHNKIRKQFENGLDVSKLTSKKTESCSCSSSCEDEPEDNPQNRIFEVVPKSVISSFLTIDVPYYTVIYETYVAADINCKCNGTEVASLSGDGITSNNITFKYISAIDENPEHEYVAPEPGYYPSDITFSYYTKVLNTNSDTIVLYTQYIGAIGGSDYPIPKASFEKAMAEGRMINTFHGTSEESDMKYNYELNKIVNDIDIYQSELLGSSSTNSSSPDALIKDNKLRVYLQIAY